MHYFQLTLDIGATDPAPFEAALSSAGALSITLQDAADDPVLEPAPGTTPLWPTVKVSALFGDDIDPQEVQRDFLARWPHVPMNGELIEDRVWEREWLKNFKPMRFGQRLWICPGDQEPPSEFPPTPNAPGPTPCIIKLDPGLAFGTGTHPTTAMCLEWLDGAALAGKRLIDFGCGSGVLAIAALKLGAAHATAVDIDPQALIATQDNALRNGVQAGITVQTAQTPIEQPADILIANILAEPLLELAPQLSRLVCSGGHLVLSGLLREQAAHVAARYATWFDIAPALFKDDWARINGVRRSR